MYDTSVLLMVIFIAAAISFLSKPRREGSPVETFQISELEYLYSYKNILLRMMQMEKDIKKFESMIGGQDDHNASALPSQPILKEEMNEINTKLEQLIQSYAIGEISLNTISFELDLLDNRLGTLSSQIAA